MVLQAKDLPNDDSHAVIAARYDQRARKDATLNMRISSVMLDEIKQAADAEGYRKYQQWLYVIISDAVAKALGHEIQTL